MGYGYVFDGFARGLGLGVGLQDRERRIEQENLARERNNLLFAQAQADRARMLERDQTSWRQGQEDRTRNIRREAEQDKRLAAAEGRAAASHKQSTRLGELQISAAERKAVQERYKRAADQISVLFMDPATGGRLADEKITQWHADRLSQILRDAGIEQDFWTVNPDVVGLNRITLVPPESGDPADLKNRRVVMDFEMKDGSIKPMTWNRSADPNDQVVTWTIPKFARTVSAMLNPERIMNTNAKIAEEQRALDNAIALETAKANAKAKAEGGSTRAGKVQRKNGDWVSESDLISSYKTEWGTPNPTNPLEMIMRADAPKYSEWRDNQLMQQHHTLPTTSAGQLGLKDADYQALAEQQLRDEMGWQDWIPIVGEPGDSEIKARAAQLKQADMEKVRAGQQGGQQAGQPAAQPRGQAQTDFRDPKYAGLAWTIQTKDGRKATITMQQIIATATNRGLPIEKVMSDFGIDPAQIKAQ